MRKGTIVYFARKGLMKLQSTYPLIALQLCVGVFPWVSTGMITPVHIRGYTLLCRILDGLPIWRSSSLELGVSGMREMTLFLIIKFHALLGGSAH